MRYDQLTNEAILEYLNRQYAKQMSIFGLRVSGDRRFTGDSNEGRIVINANLVGPNNAGDYRLWLAQSKPAWGRTFSVKPAGWHHYILMLGLQPDSQTIWWSVMYDEQGVSQSGLEPEYIRAGYGRLRPDEVRRFIVAGPYDELQMGLFDDMAPPTCDHEFACLRCGAKEMTA